VRSKTPTPLFDSRLPPVAYSYTRFSTPEQMKGDSLRRQSEASEEWCHRNGVALDTTTTLQDLGKSAFAKGKRGARDDDGMASVPELADLVNPDRRALAGFLELIKRRKVPRGAYLVIENLDRLSRDDTVPATHLLTGILLAGVRVVQLKPVEQVLTERSDGYAILMAVMELSRGNGESRMKSVRVTAAWVTKRRAARENGELMTGRVPAWIEVIDDRPQLITERAGVVKRMFTMAAAGYGCGVIVKTFVGEGVASFCAREKGADGRHKTGEGCGRWNRMYVRSILLDRRAIGEYQPRTQGGKPDGLPLTSYFPPVVSEEEFYAARAGMASRKQKQGRIGKGVACVFGGLLHDALDASGGTYCVSSRVTRDRKDPSQSRTRYVLVNSAYAAGRATCVSFPVATFERALLSMLQEIDPAEVAGRPEGLADAAVIEGELAWVRERKAALAAELLNGDVAALAAAIRSLEARESELSTKLNQAREEAVRPLEDSWRDSKDLIDLLDKALDREDVRLRLRAALRRQIDGVWMVVANRGRDRLCNAQVWFRGGEAYRSYIIIHRPSKSNGKGGTVPGRWWVNSIRQPDGIEAGLPFNTEDLRDAEQAGWIKDYLENYPQNLIERFLREGHPLP